MYTATLKEVLEGITAKHLVKLCKELSIPLMEEYITVSSLQYYDAAFITGTSPKILPVNSIDSLMFDPKNSLLRNLMSEFDILIEKYIRLK